VEPVEPIDSIRNRLRFALAIARAPDLTPAARMAGAALVERYNTKLGHCYPSIARIAADCRITTRGAEKAVAQLGATGWFLIARGGGTESNRYAPNFGKLPPLNTRPAPNQRSGATPERAIRQPPNARSDELDSGILNSDSPPAPPSSANEGGESKIVALKWSPDSLARLVRRRFKIDQVGASALVDGALKDLSAEELYAVVADAIGRDRDGMIAAVTAARSRARAQRGREVSAEQKQAGHQGRDRDADAEAQRRADLERLRPAIDAVEKMSVLERGELLREINARRRAAGEIEVGGPAACLPLTLAINAVRAGLVIDPAARLVG